MLSASIKIGAIYTFEGKRVQVSRHIKHFTGDIIILSYPHQPHRSRGVAAAEFMAVAEKP